MPRMLARWADDSMNMELTADIDVPTPTFSPTASQPGRTDETLLPRLDEWTSELRSAIERECEAAIDASPPLLLTGARPAADRLLLMNETSAPAGTAVTATRRAMTPTKTAMRPVDRRVDMAKREGFMSSALLVVVIRP